MRTRKDDGCVLVLFSVRFQGFSEIFLSLALFSILIFSVPAQTSQADANSMIMVAERSMTQAYETVLDAEKAGANVSNLSARLNYGVELLLDAQRAFEMDDFEGAVSFAELSKEVGWLVESEAEKLEVEANNEKASESVWLIIGSMLGVSFVLVMSLLGYGFFKRNYYRRRLKRKPKVGFS